MLFRTLLLLLATLAITQAADDPWHYLDPTSQMVMGVQWRRIADSAVGQRIRQEIHDGLPLPALPGGNFLGSVDHVLIASTAPPSTRKNPQPPTLIVVSGQFDLAKVRAAVNRQSRRAVVQNIEIFESPDKTSGARMGIALVSTETLLVGDMASVIRAVGAGPARDSLLLTRARQMADRNEFWVVSSVSPAEMAGPNLPLPLPLPTQDVRGLEMGFAIADGLGMDLAFQMASPEAAQKLKSELLKTIKLAAKEKNAPEMANLDKFLKISADREYVTLKLEMDASALDQRMLAWQAKRKARPAVAASAASPDANEAPARPAITKPVIWNADPPPQP